MNTTELSTASAGEAKSNRAAAEYEVHEWMGENDVVLKTPAFRALIDLVLAAQFAATHAAPGRAPLTDELVDKHLNAVLIASGSALRNYSMASTLSKMRAAMRVALAEFRGIAPAGGIGGEL